MSSLALFVYGTLRRGCANPHARMLDRSAEYVGRARVQGRLYRVDWYPGMKLGGDQWVVGDIFRILDAATMAELDRYEGSEEYQRVAATAVLETGEQAECWVYEYIVPVTEEARILSGDWLGES